MLDAAQVLEALAEQILGGVQEHIVGMGLVLGVGGAARPPGHCLPQSLQLTINLSWLVQPHALSAIVQLSSEVECWSITRKGSQQVTAVMIVSLGSSMCNSGEVIMVCIKALKQLHIT